jgi:tetratricopeptide (TPR) repeat protein
MADIIRDDQLFTLTEIATLADAMYFEIRDDKLFSQPDESFLGECPICCLPLPLDLTKSSITSCCCQRICNGCDHANQTREAKEGLEQRCPYCREPVPKTNEEHKKKFMKRVKANDPVALRELGKQYRDTGEYNRAFQCFTKAAGLGDISAHHELSVLYRKEQGVEKDKKKEESHLEEAAIGGHPGARINLGFIEQLRGRHERAAKHFIIAAKLGHDQALEMVKNGYKRGFASKDDFAAALRGHQAAVDATKSKQRENAYAFDKFFGLASPGVST